MRAKRNSPKGIQQLLTPELPTLSKVRQEDLLGEKAKPGLMKSAPCFQGWPRAAKYQAWAA